MPVLRKQLLLLAALPGLIMLVSFYSLAVHMYLALDGWPHSIGDHGFPPLLAAHGVLAFSVFYVVFMVTVFIWPVAFLASLVLPRLRIGAVYLAAYAVSCFFSFGLMLLAPSKFLWWWWD